MSNISIIAPRKAQSTSEDEIPLLQRIELAYNAWKTAKGTISCRKAARIYSVPKSTLADRIYSSKPLKEENERRQRFTLAEKEQLYNWVLQLESWGWPPKID